MPERRLLKFDVIHPQAYLLRKQSSWEDLESLSRAEYLERLNGLRSNYSDYYTYHLDDAYWEAEEFYLMDPVYLEKVARELYGRSRTARRGLAQLKQRIRGGGDRWQQRIVRDYIEAFAPDVLFARSQPLPSSFWAPYRNDTLLVARLSARLPINWHPDDFDLVFTDVPLFRDFFALHDTHAYLNEQGFDERVLDELVDREEQYDVTFVGGLGPPNFSRRTELMEEVAARHGGFQWWGYWWDYGASCVSMETYPHLARSYRGPTSGLEMFQIYRDSRVVLNDYVDTANGLGVNQRMYEVLGVGSCMLTREAANFGEHFGEGLFATFTDRESLLAQLEDLLARPEQRRQMGERGQAFVLAQYNYRDIIRRFDETLRTHLE